ncbi:hypothetical protein D3C71_1700020 [compost metagenome]
MPFEHSIKRGEVRVAYLLADSGYALVRTDEKIHRFAQADVIQVVAEIGPCFFFDVDGQIGARHVKFVRDFGE